MNRLLMKIDTPAIHRFAVWCSSVVLLLSSSGCQFGPSKPTTRWPWSKKVAPAPDRLLAVWSDSVLHQPGLPGVRGFGGRIYFYQAPKTDPIQVEGALAVYIFDADQTEPSKQQPLRKYVFTAEQLNDHMSKTSMGPSYSLWLPWDEVGGPSRRLSLITRFEAAQGGTVISDPAIKLLPGIPSAGEEKSASDLAKGDSTALKARMVVHQQTQEPVVTTQQLMGRSVQTIDLPPSFQQHIRRDTFPTTLDVLQKPPQPRWEPNLELPVLQQPLPDQPDTNSAAATTDQQVIPASASFTQVIDNRSPRGFQPTRGYQPKTGRDRDIRQGRWLEPPRPRAGSISASNTGPE